MAISNLKAFDSTVLSFQFTQGYLIHDHSFRCFVCRFLPPKSICPSGARKKRGMPRVTCDALQAWAREHGSYPTVSERVTLAQKYNVTNDQVTLFNGIETP